MGDLLTKEQAINYIHDCICDMDRATLDSQFRDRYHENNGFESCRDLLKDVLTYVIEKG